MATASGQDSDRLIHEICDEPWKHDFFQALRHIECARLESPRIGTSKRLADDPVRFGQFISLAFATSALEKPPSWEKQRGSVRKLLVRFTGLTGPHGPLPLRLTEFIRNRARGVADPDLYGTQRLSALDLAQQSSDISATSTTTDRTARDNTLVEFLDVFHHRMISLFYRAWSVAQKTVDMDRDEDRTFAEWIASLFGMGLPEMDGLDSIPTWRKVAFAGHLSNPTRHPSGLEGVLRDAFRMPVEVISLVGHWIRIPADQQSWTGRHPKTGLQCENAMLGVNCVVGARIWDRPMKFGVRLGPMTFAQFQQFQSGQLFHRQLHDWIAFYTRQQFFWEAAIVLKKEEVPQIKLGQSGRLGYTTWLSSVPFKRDPDDYRLRGGALDPAENT